MEKTICFGPSEIVMGVLILQSCLVLGFFQIIELLFESLLKIDYIAIEKHMESTGYTRYHSNNQTGKSQIHLWTDDLTLNDA